MKLSIFGARMVRMAAFGSTGVILAVYLSAVGFSDTTLGLLLTVCLFGDGAFTLLATSLASRLGNSTVLLLSSALQLATGLALGLAASSNVAVVAPIVALGVLSPSGAETGPFTSVEESLLAKSVRDGNSRTTIYAFYHTAGHFASALGAAECGFLVSQLRGSGWQEVGALQAVFLQYAVLATALAALYCTMTLGKSMEAQPIVAAHDSDDQEEDNIVSWGTLTRLGALFALDSFAGSLITGTLLAYYFSVTYSVSAEYLGGLLFMANMTAAVSSLASGWIAGRIGLLNAMIFTHLPSNLLTIAIPLMPNLATATVMVFFRFTLSQMDVAPRQSFIAGVVPPSQRTRVFGVVKVVKSSSAALGPAITGWLAADARFAWAFFLCGGLKIVYDLSLFAFRGLKPDVERVVESTIAGSRTPLLGAAGNERQTEHV